MRRIAILYALMIVTVLSCSKEDVGSEIPACVLEKVNELKANDEVPQGVSVSEYVFEERRVYVEDQGTVAFVYDKNCNTIGMLGGFAGNRKVNGRDFAEAKLIREIWRRR